MPASVADFVRVAGGCGVLQPGELEVYVQGLDRDADARPLVSRLVRDGRLTAFQAQHLYRGRATPLVLGPYIVLDLLGQGGMGCVYKAEHRLMRRIVALKVIKGAAHDHEAAVRRFEREVQAAARLEHPNIVTAFDAGAAAGIHYLAMELVEGRTLAEVVRELGPQPVAQTIDWIRQAARGLAYAHDRGVIHRDIKPGNLLLASDGTVKILDLGLARLATFDADQDQLTGTGQIMGTIDSMAPEQAVETRLADARSDIYSLGVTLWYLLTGRPLFACDTAMSKLLALMKTPAPSLRSADPGLSVELDHIFQRMVAKEPTDRFQSMAEVLAALETVPLASATQPAADLPRGTGAIRRISPLQAMAGGAIAIALLIGLGLLGQRGRGRLPGQPAPAAAVGGRRVASAPEPPAAVSPFDAVEARRLQEAWAARLGCAVATTNSVGATLVVIPPGRFSMGEGDGSVLVSLTKPFLIGQTEVTQAQWRAVMGAEPWRGQPYTVEGDQVAATFVAWDEAIAFCAKLTEQERATNAIGVDQHYRLPSEAEWEYACRAGTMTLYAFGDDPDGLSEHAWWGGGWDHGLKRIVAGSGPGNCRDDMFAHPVGRKRPNAWGLHDMHGNVWEWVADWAAAYRADEVTDPTGPPSGSRRADRGGSWADSARGCRTANRGRLEPWQRLPYLGFRVALDAPGERAP